ncbi:MAG: hypothetical protein LBS74_06135 [Oscillospiraceae bacterium]|jgi:vacuolar-type H+-ATPase subunit E/Vma4|nr:hypothetical protein [Oscillospiraceae bacterium]
MSVQDEKLSKFLTAITEYATEQRTHLLAEVEEQNRIELEKAENEVLNESYALMQKELAEMRSEMRRDLCKRQMEARSGILKKRTQIEDEVFALSQKKLAEFTKDLEYIKLLEHDAAAMHDIFKNEKSITVYVRPEDMEHSALLREAAGIPCQLEQDASIKIGGIRAESPATGLVADSTLDSALRAQREWFLENSGLFLD